MSATLPAGCGCPTPVVVSVPGTAGADGAAGVNAFTLVSSSFIVPNVNATVYVMVDDSSWVAIGQALFIFSAGYFLVVSNVSNTLGLKYFNYSGNTASGNVVTSGSKVSPCGTQPEFDYPITISLGGTGATTRAGARVALGLGQDLTSSVSSDFSQSLTISKVLISGLSATAAAAGKHLVLGSVTIEFDSAVFSTDQKILIEAINTTTSAVISSSSRGTGNVMPQYAPQYSVSSDYVVPFSQALLSAGDIVSIRASISAAPSRGAVNVTAANISLVPISLT